MNIVWTSIIIFCFIFSIYSNNFSLLINALFDVPEYSLKLLISLGGLIIIYNGIFQIALDCKIIKKNVEISIYFKNQVVSSIYSS